MSAPETKDCPPAPARTTTRISSSAAKSSRILAAACHISSETALCRSGLLKIIVPTRPSLRASILSLLSMRLSLKSPCPGAASRSPRPRNRTRAAPRRCAPRDPAAEPLPQGPAHGSDVDVAVAGLENAGRNAGRMVVARLRRHLAGVQPARGLEIEHEDLRLQERGRHFLPLAGLLALEQRHQDAKRAEETGGEGGDGDADAHRPSSRLAGDRHEPAQALRNLVHAPAVPIRAVLPEPRNARVDEPRIGLAPRRVVDAPAGLHVWPAALH